MTSAALDNPPARFGNKPKHERLASHQQILFARFYSDEQICQEMVREIERLDDVLEAASKICNTRVSSKLGDALQHLDDVRGAVKSALLIAGE